MAKERVNALKKTVERPKVLQKTNQIDTKKIEKASKLLNEEEIVKTSFNWPKWVHKYLKIAAAEEEVSMSEYLVNLIERDKLGL